jgi:long-chain acyl-CoA synthetase
VILIDGVTAEASDRARASGLELVSFARVEAVGAESIATSGRHKHSPPSPDDVATFCYTSGTTGNPKGALITHQNLVSTVAGIIQSIGDFEPHVYDRHLSFLPLAHIMERIGQVAIFGGARVLESVEKPEFLTRCFLYRSVFCRMTSMLMSGASVAFYRGDPMLLVEDLQACRPTILPVAPRVLNKIYDKVRGRPSVYPKPCPRVP